MKINKLFLCAILSTLGISLLTGCNNNNNNSIPNDNYDDNKIIKPILIGDTVKEWTCRIDSEELPIDVPSSANNGTGEGQIIDNFGRNDDCSLQFNVKVGNNNKGYLGSDALKNPFFLENDAKNGDIISFYYYVEANSNVESLQLQVLPSSMNGNGILGDVINIDETKQDKWIRTLVSFDTLETLGAIRINYTAIDAEKEVSFYIDDINIELGVETVKTDYEYNEESLYQTYEDYFKVGTCMSINQVRNTECRKIVKDNFNSITAENEGKPEQILDQAACQELAKAGDKSGVAIKVTPFEKIYDFAEANHIGVRHHTFVWYSQTPAWFFNEGYENNGNKVSKETMLKRMENFIKETIYTINDRWPGLVYAIDVANEAIDNGLRKNNNNWYTVVGDDFVYYAFLYADKYKDDDQDLYYNDYSYDYNVSNCEFALNTVLKQAIEEDLVDGVGIQGHTDSDQNMETIINDAKLIHQKGLKCQITELDITVGGTDEAAFKKQANAYSLLIKKMLENNANGETDINALIVWGITDNSSWKSYQNPLLFTSNYGKKPCYYAFLQALDEVE